MLLGEVMCLWNLKDIDIVQQSSSSMGTKLSNHIIAVGALTDLICINIVIQTTTEDMYITKSAINQ